MLEPIFFRFHREEVLLIMSVSHQLQDLPNEIHVWRKRHRLAFCIRTSNVLPPCIADIASSVAVILAVADFLLGLANGLCSLHLHLKNPPFLVGELGILLGGCGNDRRQSYRWLVTACDTSTKCKCKTKWKRTSEFPVPFQNCLWCWSAQPKDRNSKAIQGDELS